MRVNKNKTLVQANAAFMHSGSKLLDTYMQIVKMISTPYKNKTLVQANAAFMHSGSKLLDTYMQIVKNDFDAMTKDVNFDKPEEARKIINDWVSDITKSKIKDLLPEGSLSSLIRLVLVNAIYFKGSWRAKFDKNLTQDDHFKTLNGANVKVRMMERKGHYKIADFPNINARAVKIPFEYYEMLILLPEDDHGFPEVLRDINENPANLTEVLTSDQYFEEEVILKMPKFYLGGDSIELTSELQKMGLKTIFNDSADFSGITGDRSLFVSDVYHQAMIEVDEEGAEAAAATGVVMMMRCAMRPPEVFLIDHPFLFFIITRTGLPVFMGQILEPKIK
nr:serine protease inhibitor [Hymenolepis microstoma]